MLDGLGRATTAVSSLEAEQGSGNISKTQTKATPSWLNSPRTSSEGGPECHFSMGGSPVQARPERLSNLPNEPTTKDEEASLDIEDPSKQGRMIEEIDQDENVNLVKSSKQGEAHETAEHGMESDEDFSTAIKDKGKAIMQESEPPKKIKKKEMIQIGHDEELAQKLHAKELAKSTARQEQKKYDFEKALELQKHLDEREDVASKSSQDHDID
ncbi:hypothetical protein Tco_0093898 [Tanacetum coccineum]